MWPLVGDTVRITDTHRGFARGRPGKVYGFDDGRALVKIQGGLTVRVRPENLEPLVDTYGKETGNSENSRN